MKFPFTLTEQIRDAYFAHADYVSAGQRWLLRNDPEGQHERLLLDLLRTAIEQAAQEHFGDDERAYWDFWDEFLLDEYTGDWYDELESRLEAA